MENIEGFCEYGRLGILLIRKIVYAYVIFIRMEQVL
jgi:hypothetical protein